MIDTSSIHKVDKKGGTHPMSQQELKQKGFTIIEVVLVLAIAALIFLMVFIALPALQRNQRDAARKNDASVIATGLGNLKSSNNGSFGTGALTATTVGQYVDKLSQYDKATDISVVTADVTATDTKVTIIKGRKCAGTTPAPGTLATNSAAGTSRTAAVYVVLENTGSAKQLYCVDA